jgi:apolipoprotein N-acyltransferase
MQMMQPTDGTEWFSSVAIVVSYAVMTIAVTTSTLSITVTKKHAGRKVGIGAVLVVNLALSWWLTYSFGAGPQGWAPVWCTLAVAGWAVVAVSMFYRSRSAVEVGPRSGVERYFGVNLR